MLAEASIKDTVSQLPALLSALRCSRVPKFLPKIPKASMPTSDTSPTATPNQGRSRSAGCTYSMIGWSGKCELRAMLFSPREWGFWIGVPILPARWRFEPVYWTEDRDSSTHGLPFWPIHSTA
jgi:hypothetical protein